jgi:crotonobetainyl-CoA:carnitine CoA-transferase CaiB-like acyl-CoA transferase
MGGLMSITGTSEPTKAGVAVVDVLTGLHGAVAMLAALRHRELTGQGQNIEVSLLSSLLSSLVNQASGYVGAGVVPTYMGNAHPSISPYEVYQSADRPIVIAVGNDGQFAALAGAISRPGLASDPRFVTNPLRVTNRSALAIELTAVLETHGAEHWQRIITAAGVPCGPINDISQAFNLATELGLNPIAVINKNGESVAQVANPVHYSATPVTYRLAPPTVGQDNSALIAEFGLG